MPRFAANISTMYQDRPFLERIEAAAASGFEAVECQFPYEAPAEEIKVRLDAAGLRMVLINTPPGDFEAGERGLAGVPGRHEDFRAAFERALDYARVLDCPCIHVMAGVVSAAARREACLSVFRSNLRVAAAGADKAGRMLLVEPINPFDIPGYMVNTQDEGAEIVDAIGHPRVRLQLDLYHTQRTTGNLADLLRRHAPRIGHIQIAGVPGRHEPDVGEIHYPYLFGVIDEIGYAGWVGCEYVPRAKTEDGLAWLEPYGVKPKGG
jgi:2-dehydrotetronate isomerase